MGRTINIEVIKQAILHEVEGYQFYKLYADKVTDPGVRDIFLTIAADELKHIEFLRKLASGSEEDKLRMATIEVPSPGIFKFSSLTPDELSLAVSAFSIAMKLEDDSQRFYEEAAAAAETEAEQVLYLVLRDWEISHRDAFETQYLELRQEWWTDNSFAPF